MANKTKSTSKAKSSRSGKKRTSKIIPANRYLRYELTNSATPGTETSHYVDLAKDLSAINRRLMRQGRMYHVKRISIVSSNTFAFGTHVDQSEIPGVSTFTQNAGRITFSVAPDGWVTRNAWKRGFGAFNRMNERATENVGGKVTPKYHDFKVYLTNDHRDGTKLTPKDNGGNDVNAGEWDYTDLVSPDGTTSADVFGVHLLGNHVSGAGVYSNIGLVKSYGDGRMTVNTESPNAGGFDKDDPILNLFDDGTVLDEVLENLDFDNQGPPYNINNYVGDGSNLPKPHVVQQTTLGVDGRASVGGFTAMCGLIEIETTSPIADDVYSVLVELAPGKYRGIGADVI